jgi:phosphoribosylformylglycinamidine synthase
MLKFSVQVLPKPEVLDSQGRAVENLLIKEGFKLNSCRVGKYIELEMEGSDEKQALENLKKMSEYVLYNPLIEKIEIKKI